MNPMVTTVNSSVSGTRNVHKGRTVVHTNTNHTVVQTHGAQPGILGPSPGYPAQTQGYPTPAPMYPAHAKAHTVLPAHTAAPAVVLIPPTQQPPYQGVPVEHSIYITDQPNVKL